MSPFAPRRDSRDCCVGVFAGKLFAQSANKLDPRRYLLTKDCLHTGELVPVRTNVFWSP